MFTSNSFPAPRVTRFAAALYRIALLGVFLGCYASTTPAQILFSENFDSYAPGTCIGGPVWTQDYGCVAAIAAPHPGWDGNAVDGDASNSLPQGLSGAQITAPVANAPTTGILELSFRAWSPTQTPYYGGDFHLLTPAGARMGLEAWSNIHYNNAWLLYADAAFTGWGDIVWQSPPLFMRDTDVRATLVLDYDALEFWARLTDGSTEWITPKIPFSGIGISGIGVYEDDRGSRGLDMDDIVLTSFASPAIKPTKGGNVGNVTVSLNYLDLAPDTIIRLSAPGMPDIVGQDTDVVSPILTRTTFDLTGAIPGARDVVATTAGGSEVSLPSAFEVINGGGPLLAIDLLGNVQPRLGRDTNYLAVVRNIGFNDSYDGVVTVGVDEATAALEQGSGSIINDHALVSGLLLSQAVGQIGPGSSQAFTFPYTPSLALCRNLTGEFKDPCEKERAIAEATRKDLLNERLILAAAIAGYLAADCLSHPDTKGCLALAATTIVRLNMLNAKQNAYNGAISLLALCEGKPPVPPIPPVIIEPIPPLPDIPPPPPPVPPGLPSTTTHLRGICPIASWDPNDKVGPSGSGAEGYVSSSLPFAYTVHFENLASASAAAQDVVVTDQLDPALDWKTFEIGSIRFGDRAVEVPPGSQDFSTTVDLRPDQNLAVNVDVNLGPKTGLVTWQFKSVDPDTGGIPSDPAAGFLPPNKVPPEGEASVFFSVRAREDAQTGTEIHNKATIVFDVNPSIETGQWLNTVDNTKPQSEVLPLNGVQQSPTFQVQWAGTDGESGVRKYTVYVSENDGPASVLVNNTDETAVSFTGKPGSRYAFYSMAMDYAGNVEGIPQLPDTSMRIALPGDLNGDNTVNCSDIAIVKASFGKRKGQPGFDPRADVNGDNVVDIRDLSFVSRQLPAGTICK